MKIPHQPRCEYFADGGDVEPMGTPMPMPEATHPSFTLGHAAVHHGLTGLLGDVGAQSLAHPDKYKKKLEETKTKMSMGDIPGATDSLQGHPLTGKIPQSKLGAIVHRLAPEVVSRDVDPAAFRTAADYLHSSMKGHDALDTGAANLFEKQNKSDRMKPDEDRREKINGFLKNVQQNPGALLDVGGSLGYYLPEHAAELGAFASRATEYLNSIRPKETQLNPLDKPIAPDANSMHRYRRQVDLAENPALVLQHVKDGTLMPSDVRTVQFLYPQLYKSMQDKAAQALIDARTQKKEIPYQQQISLGMLLGQPLNGSTTPAGMQAIIKANGMDGGEPQPAPSKKKSSGKATGVMLKQINMVDDIGENPIENRLINSKTK
jgi:hypothetical protein